MKPNKFSNLFMPKDSKLSHLKVARMSMSSTVVVSRGRPNPRADTQQEEPRDLTQMPKSS